MSKLGPAARLLLMLCAVWGSGAMSWAARESLPRQAKRQPAAAPDRVQATSRATTRPVDSIRQDPSLTVEQSAKCLIEAKRFKDIAVGDGGEMPDEVQAFRVLISRQDAPGRFQIILKQGSTAGQLYALCGLYLSDQRAFKNAVASYRTRKDVVETMEGCCVDKRPIKELVESHHRDVVRLKSGQTLDQWFLSHSSSVLDIVGGGWPERLRGNTPRATTQPEPN